MNDEMIRVAIADDHAIVREGIRVVLDQSEGFEIVGEAEDGTEALALAQSVRPDVLVLDVSMPGASGLEVARQLGSLAPEVRVLMLSVYDDAEYVLEAVKVGAHGYLLKDSGPAELRRAIRAVHEGEGFFSPSVARQLGQAVRDEEHRAAATSQIDLLTSRERDVLALIAAGRTNKEAAASLGISHRTVESHRENLMKKLGIRTVAELTRFALETGLLDE